MYKPTALEMEIEVKAYVRLEQWAMNWYMEHRAPVPEKLRESKRKEIRKEVIEEYKLSLLKGLREIL